jgi:hypothetical protein
MIRRSTVPVTKEMQAKTTARYHFTSTRMAIVTEMENDREQKCREF